MGNTGHQIDETDRVADGDRLFGNRLMRLAVGLIHHHPRRTVGVPVRSFAALLIFDIVKMRLRSARLNEVLHQRDIARLLSDVVQAH